MNKVNFNKIIVILSTITPCNQGDIQTRWRVPTKLNYSTLISKLIGVHKAYTETHQTLGFKNSILSTIARTYMLYNLSSSLNK